MAMFDPFYATSVLEDILSRELGVELKLTLTKEEAPQGQDGHSSESSVG